MRLVRCKNYKCNKNNTGLALGFLALACSSPATGVSDTEWDNMAFLPLQSQAGQLF